MTTWVRTCKMNAIFAASLPTTCNGGSPSSRTLAVLIPNRMQKPSDLLLGVDVPQLQASKVDPLLHLTISQCHWSRCSRLPQAHQ